MMPWRDAVHNVLQAGFSGKNYAEARGKGRDFGGVRLTQRMMLYIDSMHHIV